MIDTVYEHRMGQSDVVHVVTVLKLVAAYNVDILHSQNAEAFAVTRRVACESWH